MNTKVTDDNDVEINGNSEKVGRLKDIFTTCCKGYGLEFTSTPAMKDLRGTFQVNLCLIYAFRFRCNEGVYLNNVYKRGEIGGIDKVTMVSQCGVKPAHLPFTYGANCPHSIQSALMQQLGPTALLIGLCEIVSQDCVISRNSQNRVNRAQAQRISQSEF